MRTEQWAILRQIANAEPPSESLFRHWCDEQWQADLHLLREHGREATSLDWQTFWDNLTRSLMERSDLRLEQTRDKVAALVKVVTEAPDAEAIINTLVSPDVIVRELTRSALLARLDGIVETFPALGQQAMTHRARMVLAARTAEKGWVGFRKDKDTEELFARAREEITEAEVEASYRELQEKGGMELSQFLSELEQIVARP